MAAATLAIAVVLLSAGAVTAADHLLLEELSIELDLAELALVNECTDYKELSSPDRSVDYTNKSIEHCDAELSPGWYRFTQSAGSHMATQCVRHYHCSSINPGWLNGSHPTVREGVVGRLVCFQSDENCCYGSMKILVRNCGEYFVYMLFGVPCPFRYCGGHRPPTTPRPSTSPHPTTLPSFPPALKVHRKSDECSNYKSLTSEDRSVDFYNPFIAEGDYNLKTGWYRFMDKAGTKMADHCVPRFHCGTHSPGWLLDGHPINATNHAVKRDVCFHWRDNCCFFKQEILVRECEGFYVYKLKQNKVKYLRYCGNETVSI